MAEAQALIDEEIFEQGCNIKIISTAVDVINLLFSNTDGGCLNKLGSLCITRNIGE